MLKRIVSITAITLSFLVISTQAVTAQETETPETVAEEAAVNISPPVADPYIDQSRRLYRAALGREGDPVGIEFWADRLREGFPLEEVARFLLESEEGQASTGDPILDAYEWALGREPEPGGYAYWAAFSDPAIAVAAVSDSLEHQTLTETTPPPVRGAELETTSFASGDPDPQDHPQGWVDAGHGIWVPKILLSIRRCESGGDYQAQNRRSTASGGYQFLNSSWAAYGHASRYGVNRAKEATPAQQDEAAVITWERDGTRPWAASRHCWS